MSHPKFYVGQRVIAVEDHVDGDFKAGDIFTVTGIKSICCGYSITIGIKSPSCLVRCTKCAGIYASFDEADYRENRFAPLHENFKKIEFTKVIEQVTSGAN